MWTASGFDGGYGYRRVFEGLLPLGFRTPTCPKFFSGTFNPTFTTTAFDRSSSDWFETCS